MGRKRHALGVEMSLEEPDLFSQQNYNSLELISQYASRQIREHFHMNVGGIRSHTQ